MEFPAIERARRRFLQRVACKSCDFSSCGNSPNVSEAQPVASRVNQVVCATNVKAKGFTRDDFELFCHRFDGDLAFAHQLIDQLHERLAEDKQTIDRLNWTQWSPQWCHHEAFHEAERCATIKPCGALPPSQRRRRRVHWSAVSRGLCVPRRRMGRSRTISCGFSSTSAVSQVPSSKPTSPRRLRAIATLERFARFVLKEKLGGAVREDLWHKRLELARKSRLRRVFLQWRRITSQLAHQLASLAHPISSTVHSKMVAYSTHQAAPLAASEGKYAMAKRFYQLRLVLRVFLWWRGSGGSLNSSQC